LSGELPVYDSIDGYSPARRELPGAEIRNGGIIPNKKRMNVEHDTSDFVEHVMEIVRAIPPGRVMTYGDVAATLGTGGARAVGTVMARYGADVPWWRVIRAGGLAPRGHEERARSHYLTEGTPLKGPSDAYRIDLTKARFGL
jgi:alkylated DNA nucleotide flippase Atl1